MTQRDNFLLYAKINPLDLKKMQKVAKKWCPSPWKPLIFNGDDATPPDFPKDGKAASRLQGAPDKAGLGPQKVASWKGKFPDITGKFRVDEVWSFGQRKGVHPRLDESLDEVCTKFMYDVGNETSYDMIESMYLYST